MCFLLPDLPVYTTCTMFQQCFEVVSIVLTCEGTSPDRWPSALATLRGVDLDPSNLSRILGVDVPGEVGTVSGVTCDSRAAGPGFAFVAVPGFKQDGTVFASDARRRGAALVVAERPVEGVPTAIVPDARDALAALARA